MSKPTKSKEKQNQYLDLVGFKTPEQAYEKIKEWTSNLSDDDHFVRSVIFDIHAGIEVSLRQIIYHHLKTLVFETGEEQNDKKVTSDLEKMVDDLSFGQMYRMLWPILKNWPYDLASIGPINDLRNQVAHQTNIENINYRGRNPFRDADSFAQVFFDAWATRQELGKFCRRRVIGPWEEARAHYKELQELKRKSGE